MREVFADAGYWIAMLNPSDALHEQAEAVTKQLGDCQIVATEMVLVELLNFFSGRGEYYREHAAEIVRTLIANPDIEVMEQTTTQFVTAVDRYASRLDHKWSVTDCASFLLMEKRYIKEALAHDHNFEQAGFVALLR